MRRLTKPRRKPTLGSPAEFATEPLKLGGSSGRYDLPTVEADPDMLVDARIAATAGTYGALRITDLALHAELAPGRLVLHDMSLGLVGGKAKVWASAEPAGNGTRVSANAAVTAADLQEVVRLLHEGPPMLWGHLDGHAAIVMTGPTVPDGLKASRISGVLTLHDGRVARALLELASTDLRRMFRKGKGTARISCLLAVTDLRNGVGFASPLRLHSSEGMITGGGRIDLNRRLLDLRLHSDPTSTGFFALDVPVRITGPFGDPNIVPDLLSAAPARSGEVNLASLPVELETLAQANPCPP